MTMERSTHTRNSVHFYTWHYVDRT